MNPVAPEAPSSLCARLKAGTADLHHQAERTRLVRALLQGRLPRREYGLLLAGLHSLYAALEAGLTLHAGHHLVAPWRHDGLARLPSLDADLCNVVGDRWRDELPCPREASAYAQHLEALSADDPALLVSHAYVRYLGDLYGGQLIARVVSQHYPGPRGPAVAFYHFGDAASVGQQIRQLRSGLDGLGVDEQGTRRLVAEARDAYARHERLFEEVAAALD